MRRADRHQQLIDVARVAFAQRGYYGTSIEHVAELAGISKPIIYDHFTDKEGLYEAVVRGEIEFLTESTLEAVEESFDDLYQLLERTTMAVLDYAEEHPMGFQIIARYPMSFEHPSLEGNLWWSSLLGEFSSTLAAAFGRVLKKYGHDDTSIQLYTHIIVGAIELATRWWGSGRNTAGYTKEQVAKYCVSLLWNGLDRLPVEP
jgi:AcrR family transcriptional regulator